MSMEELERLKAADIPVATCERMGMSITGETDAAEVEAAEKIAHIDKYLSQFAWSDGKCVSCGRDIGGMFGTFVWGFINGEGSCAECKYPARAIHNIKDDKDVQVFERPLQMILQYHPSVLEFGRQEAVT